MLFIEKLTLIHVLFVNDSTARVFLKRSLHISSSRGHLIGNMGCFSKDFHFQQIFLIFQPISEITNDIVPDVIRYFNIPFHLEICVIGDVRASIY